MSKIYFLRFVKRTDLMIRQIFGVSLFLARLAEQFLSSVNVRNVSLARASHGCLYNYVVREYFFFWS